MKVTFDTYQLVDGSGARFCCHCKENGNSRLVFFGDTAEDALAKATAFANSTLDTPERREMLRLRAEARAKARKAKEAA